MAAALSLFLQIIFVLAEVCFAALPNAREFNRVTWCFNIKRFLDLTAVPEDPEKLAPCVPKCRAGTVAVDNQCAWPTSAIKQLRLRFELHLRCERDDCEWLGQQDMHLHIVCLKLSQFLGVPVGEIKAAVLSWGVAAWPPPPLTARLQRFLFVRRGETDFPKSASRRLGEAAHRRGLASHRAGEEYQSPWYLIRMAFRIDTMRVTQSLTSVNQLITGNSRQVSAFIGTQVEVKNADAFSTDYSSKYYEWSDFKAIYKFAGYNVNVDPFVGGGLLSGSPWHCRDPCYIIDEKKNRLGAERCSVGRGACDCNGQRECSDIGYCIGSTHGCVDRKDNREDVTTTVTTTIGPNRTMLVPGFLCTTSSTSTTAALPRADHSATSLHGCATGCRADSTCVGFEWRMPKFCVLVRQLTGAMLGYGSGLTKVGDDDAYYPCVQLEELSPGVTTTAGRGSVSTLRPLFHHWTTTLPLPQESVRPAVEELDRGTGWNVWFMGIGFLVACCFAGVAVIVLCQFRISRKDAKVNGRSSAPPTPRAGWFFTGQTTVDSLNDSAKSASAPPFDDTTMPDFDLPDPLSPKSSEADTPTASDGRDPFARRKSAPSSPSSSGRGAWGAAPRDASRRSRCTEWSRVGSPQSPPPLRRSRSAMAGQRQPLRHSSIHSPSRTFPTSTESTNPCFPSSVPSSPSLGADVLLSFNAELLDMRGASLGVRRRFFMAQCLKWHPDKNVGAEQTAKLMFQLLQDKKEWFLQDD